MPPRPTGWQVVAAGALDGMVGAWLGMALSGLLDRGSVAVLVLVAWCARTVLVLDYKSELDLFRWRLRRWAEGGS